MRLRSVVVLIALSLTGLGSLVRAQDRVECPQIRYVELSTERESDIVKLRFETENSASFPVEAELRVSREMVVAYRALPQFGSKITHQTKEIRLKLRVIAPPGKERHDERASMDQERQSMTTPMAAQNDTMKLFESYGRNGFELGRCRKY